MAMVITVYGIGYYSGWALMYQNTQSRGWMVEDALTNACIWRSGFLSIENLSCFQEASSLLKGRSLFELHLGLLWLHNHEILSLVFQIPCVISNPTDLTVK